MNYITPTVKIQLPFIIVFEDYHEAMDYKEYLNKLFKENIKYRELGYWCGYVCMFYTGRIPTKKEIKENLLSDYDEQFFEEWNY